MQLKYVKMHDEVVDIFTKPLKCEDFVNLRYLLGVEKSRLRVGVLNI